jgi:hypothetical protein
MVFKINNPDALSHSEHIDAALDMLVDDELPEQPRRELLEQMDQTADGWRAVAIRFLQRQVERRAVRSMVSPAAAAAHGSSALRFLGALRIAATVLITATLFGVAGLYVGRQNGATPAISPSVAVSPHVSAGPAVAAAARHPIEYINTTLPPNFGGSSVQVPVMDSNAMPAGYPFVSNGSPQQPGNIMIVPDGPNQAVAFPVVPAADDKQKVY